MSNIFYKQHTFKPLKNLCNSGFNNIAKLSRAMVWKSKYGFIFEF